MVRIVKNVRFVWIVVFVNGLRPVDEGGWMREEGGWTQGKDRRFEG